MQAPDAGAEGPAVDEQFRRFIADAPVAIAMFDRDMRYIAASRRWMGDYGVAGEDLTGRSHYEAFPDQPPQWRDVHRRALAGETCTAEEDRYVRADGRVHWMRWDVRPWFSDHDAIGGIVILAEDITARKQAEDALRLERDKLASLISAVGVGIVVARMDGGIELLNAFAMRLAGYEPASGDEIKVDDLSARFTLSYPDDRPMPPSEWPMARALRGEYVRDYVAILRRLDIDFSRTVHYTASPIRDATGKVVLIAFVISDFTELHRAQGMLRVSEDRYRAVFDAAPNALIVINRDGIIEATNAAAQAIFGYTAAELNGSNVSILMPNHEADAHDRYMARYRQSGEAAIIGIGRIVMARRKNGEEFPAELTVTTWINEASERVFCGTMTDLTDRWRTEQALAEAQRLEAVGVLAGGVAHDFNNALAVILGNLELAEVRISDAVTGDLIARALRAAKMASTVTRRLLSLARTAGETQMLSLNDTVRETLPLLESLTAGQWTLRIVLADDLWPAVANPGELASAVLNLASNARDAMPSGGTIEIATSNVRVDQNEQGAQPGDYVCLTISDTGEGMSAEVLSRVWEPFYSTKREGSGTGLGLTTVRNLVKQAHGFARITSAPGKGTTVSLFLPRSAQTLPDQISEPLSGASHHIPMGNGEVILVVDDNDAVRETAMRRLEALGYVVSEARSGDDAIAQLSRGEAVDLVLTDVVMPGLSGYQVADWIAVHRPEVRVVLASGYPGEVDAPQSDGWPLLQKPYTREQLARCIYQALAGQNPAADGQPQNT